MGRTFRLVAGGITLAGLGLQYWLMTHYPSSKSVITAAIHFFSFFTIQTNALIAACLLLPAIVPGSRTGQLLGKPSVRIAVVAYGALTALVYFAVLRDIGHDNGLERRADQVLHYVTPALFFIDWLALVPKGHVPFRSVPTFLIYPALYIGWTFLYGALTDWYPYPFVNAGRLGFGQLAANFIGLACIAFVIPYALVVLDRLLAGVRRQRG